MSLDEVSVFGCISLRLRKKKKGKNENLQLHVFLKGIKHTLADKKGSIPCDHTMYVHVHVYTL